MPYRYLLKNSRKLETGDMRLPQSTTNPLSFRVFSVITFTLCATMLPLCVRAEAQQLTFTPSTLHFGSVVIGQSETEVVVLTNSGKSSVTVSAKKSSESVFSASGLTLPLVLSAGQSVPVNVRFSPHATGWKQAGITFTSNASNPTLQLEVGGTGATSDSLKSNPASVSFGQVAVGTKSVRPVVLTNTRTWKTTLNAFQMTGGEFSVSGLTLPVTLSAGQSVTINLTFAPLSAGTSGGELFVTGPDINVPLSGIGTTKTATGQLSITPGSVSFGSVNVGSTGTQSITLSATGASVTVSADTASNAQFALQGVSLPFTISAGQSVSYNVAFKPTASGAVSGSLSITSNATNAPTMNVPLSGTGTTTTTAGQLSITPGSVSFGNVNVGSTGTQPITLSTTGASVTVSADTASNAQFALQGVSLPFTISAGQSVSYNVAFKPTASGAVSGSLSITSNATNAPSLNVSLSGTGTTTTTAGQLSITPGSVSFGNVNVGSTGTQPITLSASGASVMVSADASNNSQFVLQGATLPFTISAGKSLSYNVAFKPTASGTVSGSLSITSNATNASTLSVPLSGTGTTTTTAGQLSITPSSVSFGNVNVGSTGTQAISMSATGASVTVSADASNNSQFVLQGATLPFTIPAGQSVSYNVAFKPTASATVSGSLSFTSNAASSPTVESLTGIGTAAAQYSVSLSWNPSSDVVGYNVYRSTSSTGTYTKVNSTVDANTTYTDSTVAAGQIYYYEATSVNSAGEESARSTPPVEASIP